MTTMTNSIKLSLQVLMLALWLTAVGCGSKYTQEKPDYTYVREYGYQYARKYHRLLHDGSNEMEREKFLLHIQSLQYQLEQETNAEIASEFYKAFCDSTFVYNAEFI